ncbi:hypothetical protein [Kitasatospora sp. NPDC017646]|uniref:hypothetical protein n=1 Tax=Kitasatospora sp. NPDC017646 TaxID=3364024 RepID=UPI0037BA79D0
MTMRFSSASPPILNGSKSGAAVAGSGGVVRTWLPFVLESAGDGVQPLGDGAADDVGRDLQLAPQHVQQVLVGEHPEAFVDGSVAFGVERELDRQVDEGVVGLLGVLLQRDAELGDDLLVEADLVGLLHGLQADGLVGVDADRDAHGGVGPLVQRGALSCTARST